MNNVMINRNPGPGSIELSKKEEQALSTWYSGKRDTSELLRILGLTGASTRNNDYVEQEQIPSGFDEADFDFEQISDQLEEKRILELRNGAPPTEEEINIWAEELIMDGRFLFRYHWRVVHADFELEFTTDHGDGGYIDHYSGPTFIKGG